ncbi:hypothetical protein DK65_325 [Brucella pinnipedialis]|nr:hypothetical protein DK65_325 [Brucella pinnipedialis]ENR15017.1 hypothetical protein C066_00924 [Brucella sp. UK5/01]ENT15939.1 hypothetical protein C067_00951 [Brucella sp. F8/99]ENT23165.1 hypothetical protein C051_01027 [Brucella sp. UK40/99]
MCFAFGSGGALAAIAAALAAEGTLRLRRGLTGAGMCPGAMLLARLLCGAAMLVRGRLAALSLFSPLALGCGAFGDRCWCKLHRRILDRKFAPRDALNRPQL